MTILTMDTSNQLLGAAVVRDGITLAEHVMHGHRDHSVRLLPAVERLLKEAKVTQQELSQIVVAQGPGSYTGVRIAMSTAKTMAWALGIEVKGVSSLEALAYQGQLFDGLICPFFDARRGQVYTALYDGAEAMAQTEAEANPVFADWLVKLADKKRKVLFLSPDMEKHRQTIENQLGSLAVIPTGSVHFSRPSVLADLAQHKEASNLHTIVPNYIRITEAESNWLKQQEKPS